MLTWLDLYPDRCEHEIQALTSVSFQVDRHQLEVERRLVMRGSVTTPDGDVALILIYPDSFPYLRPEVFAPDLSLRRHQNIYNGNLCLLDRNSRAWEVDLTGAWLVTERVPHLLQLLAAGGDELVAGEAPQGEPTSVYFPAQTGTTVFVGDELLQIGTADDHGRLELAYGRAEPPTLQLRAAVRRVTAKGPRGGTLLASCEERITERFNGKTLDGRWVRLAALPKENTPAALLAASIEIWPELRQPRYTQVSDGQLDVIGCVFREEVRQGEWQDGWLFVVRHRQRVGNKAVRDGMYLTRGDRLSVKDLSTRVPDMRDLRDKHVVVIGLGALGAPVALELARIGVGTLSLVDYDRVEVGNSVRWPIGLRAVGHEKTDVIGATILDDYPYTKVNRLTGRIGDTNLPAALSESRRQSELDVLSDFLADADLIIDATAELGVQHLVSSLAGSRPVIYAWATEGGAGGVIARIRPVGGCWICLQQGLLDGTLPTPAADEQETVQPRGCGTSTFTGRSFDLLPVVAQAARVAAETLSGAEHVPDLSVMSLRQPNGEAAPGPTWRFHSLEVNPECACSHGVSDARAA